MHTHQQHIVSVSIGSLSDPGTMAKGNPGGQSTAAVSSTHAAKLTGYNQAGKTGPTTAAGLEAL